MGCKRCGKCCSIVGRLHWTTGNLDAMQKKFLRDILAGNPVCEMLVYEGGQAVCLVHKMFGKEHKPVACQEYNEDGKCEAQNDR